MKTVKISHSGRNLIAAPFGEALIRRAAETHCPLVLLMDGSGTMGVVYSLALAIGNEDQITLHYTNTAHIMGLRFGLRGRQMTLAQFRELPGIGIHFSEDGMVIREVPSVA